MVSLGAIGLTFPDRRGSHHVYQRHGNSAGNGGQRRGTMLNGRILGGKRFARSSSVSANRRTMSLFSDKVMAIPCGKVNTSPLNKEFTLSRFSPTD